MTKSPFPKSIRKHIRREKSRLRRVYLSQVEAEEKIKEMVKSLAQHARAQN